MRKEHDFLGELEVPDDVYYGVQTMRAIENFSITGRRLDEAWNGPSTASASSTWAAPQSGRGSMRSPPISRPSPASSARSRGRISKPPRTFDQPPARLFADVTVPFPSHGGGRQGDGVVYEEELCYTGHKKKHMSWKEGMSGAGIGEAQAKWKFYSIQHQSPAVFPAGLFI